MGKKALLLIVALCLALAPLAACQSVGKATGTAVKSVEKGGEDFQKGYEEGKSGN